MRKQHRVDEEWMWAGPVPRFEDVRLGICGVVRSRSSKERGDGPVRVCRESREIGRAHV